jgi:hypothetical protein
MTVTIGAISGLITLILALAAIMSRWLHICLDFDCRERWYGYCCRCMLCAKAPHTTTESASSYEPLLKP